MLRAALRNYASRAFVVGNPTLYSALLFLAITPSWVAKVGPGLRHGTTAAMDHAGANPLSMTAFMGMTSISTYYWRQVGESLATTIPGFLAAELRAGLTVVALLFVALTIPLLWCGLPVAGAAAFVAFSFTFAAGGRPVRGEKRSLKWLRVGIMTGGALFSFIPQWQIWLLFLPWPLAAGIVAVCGTLVVLGMTYHAGRTQAEQEQAENRADSRRTSVMQPGVVGRTLGHLMLWQPPMLRQAPLPPTLARPLGPAGILLMALASVTGMLAISAMTASIMVLMHEGAFAPIFRDTARGGLVTLPGVTLMVLSNWLLNRKDWPFFFMAGRYGSRVAFARTMFRAYRLNVLLWGVGVIVPVMLVLVLLGSVPGAAAGWLGVLLVLMFTGACYGSSVPLIWRELGGKGVTIAAGMAAYMAMILANPVVLYRAHHADLAIAASLAIFVAGMAVSQVAPRQLTRMDWPFDGE
ncbi:hypothetical protein [Gluconacetobacter diazotrophicus]|uniref:hypothetical protein n=1 Tax=Gluconacetobacter diazotrophicus TaxID=33996 RepID=UPI00059B6F7A|nr:hypothetical protein [Gluconacetobacter diazotrophicus]